jgi:hypothetical protein
VKEVVNEVDKDVVFEEVEVNNLGVMDGVNIARKRNEIVDL